MNRKVNDNKERIEEKRIKINNYFFVSQV